MNTDSSVLFEAENEEDTFYAEIRKQILLLTSEDNEDLLETRSLNPLKVTNGSSNSSIYSVNSVPPPRSNFCLWENQCSSSPPVWLVNLWKNSKGTGVFIPQVACKKNQKPGANNPSLSSYTLGVLHR
ncbi:uncharacterized protein LOC113872120 isoform X2 [Abrus precatorius]|uniref:Uncharacterized protein LOC113872120 isoform X2 n=1 Tax=Abrus precatorius TaxID=3816 RepID=A0A8B8MDJ6_ABRPR|nr:uncharacterized protein LOC113872120 isoform X2 [Abrus precatorius]